MKPTDYERAVAQLAEDIASDMRVGEYTEDLWAEISRMMNSGKVEDRDAVEDMSLADIILIASAKRAASDISLDAIDKILDQWREEAARRSCRCTIRRHRTNQLNQP